MVCPTLARSRPGFESRQSYMDFERIDTETIGRYDLTPLFHDRSVFAQLIEELAEPFRDETDVVVGL